MDTLVCAAATAAEGGPESFLKHIERLLSAGHRDDTLGGCPLVAMGSELVRADQDARHAASQGFEALIDIVAKWMPGDDIQTARVNAAYILSSVIGVVTMSRIIGNRELSDQMLDMAKSHLVNRPEKPPRGGEKACDEGARDGEEAWYQGARGGEEACDQGVDSCRVLKEGAPCTPLTPWKRPPRHPLRSTISSPSISA